MIFVEPSMRENTMQMIPPENHSVIATAIVAAMIIGLTVAGRQAADVQQLVGALTSVLALYVVRQGTRPTKRDRQR
ncbi:hypothetical protein [Streptosporangium sandarakinum]